LLGISAVFGAIGFFGWFFKVPESVLTFGFLALFAVQCVLRLRWKRVAAHNKAAVQQEEQVAA
jgi:hypothetical protein